MTTYDRRLSDKLLIAFDQACDQRLVAVLTDQQPREAGGLAGGALVADQDDRFVLERLGRDAPQLAHV